jgi:hypothetical protein
LNGSGSGLSNHHAEVSKKKNKKKVRSGSSGRSL